MKNFLVLLLCISGSSFVGCGSDSTDDGGDPSIDDVDCEGDLPTYESFGKDFVDEYCLSCHSEKLKGPVARTGAPDEDNFDSLELIGPKAEEMATELFNGDMPYGTSKKPSDDDRAEAVRWLHCDAK